ncbi:hypothetical protein WA026_002331 [Henosepilachna vigintioctopunctata]|uniref:KAT8 regulatory NSL complex subunit 2 n=1 Tax=Henosepilachna vigintioctopunctata TaxID=420089 RepID=A0AAW1U1G1_9CUCU
MNMPMKSQKSSVQACSADEDMSTAALKKALQIELHNKKPCSYQPYECSQLSLDGFNFCAKHILNEKNAPFKQCHYTYPNNGKKCHLPAVKGDLTEISYCNNHALKATLIKNRQNCKFQPPHTAEVILNSLSHYIKKPRSRTHSQQSDEGGSCLSTEENLELKVSKSLDPFNIDAFNLYNSQCNDILGYCSESDSDLEPSSLTNIWHDVQADSSDNESIDSEQEDSLKYANVYTSEEITSIARDKLIRLQSLYIEEYRHLQYILTEKRRKYLQALKREKETCCNIFNQIRDNHKEQRLYKKLKAYNSYHKAHGVEAILSKKLYDLRAKVTEGIPPKSNSFTKCLFTEGGVKCGERTLPLAKHCRKHILEDPNQVLFRSCGRVRADVECNTPVEAIFDDSTCKLHADIPSLKSYNQTRKDSESDYEEPVDNSLPTILDQTHLHLSSMVNIKSELLEFTSEVPKMESVPSMLFEDSANDTNEDEMEIDVFEENLKPKEDNKELIDEEKLKFSGVPNENLDINSQMNLEETIDQTDIQTYSKIVEIESDASNIENTSKELNNTIKNIVPEDCTKSEHDKLSEVESPVEMDVQFDESTDTASETMNEFRKEAENTDSFTLC